MKIINLVLIAGLCIFCAVLVSAAGFFVQITNNASANVSISLLDNTTARLYQSASPLFNNESNGTWIMINTTLMHGEVPIEDAECELDIISEPSNRDTVDFRSLFNPGDGTYTYVWKKNVTSGNYTVQEYCHYGEVFNLQTISANTTITVT